MSVIPGSFCYFMILQYPSAYELASCQQWRDMKRPDTFLTDLSNDSFPAAVREFSDSSVAAPSFNRVTKSTPCRDNRENQ